MQLLTEEMLWAALGIRQTDQDMLDSVNSLSRKVCYFNSLCLAWLMDDCQRLLKTKTVNNDDGERQTVYEVVEIKAAKASVRHSSERDCD